MKAAYPFQLTESTADKSIRISAPSTLATEKAVHYSTLRWICCFVATVSAQIAMMIFSSNLAERESCFPCMFSMQAQGLVHGSCARKAPQACTEIECSAKHLWLLINTSFPLKAEFQWEAGVVWQPFV